MKILMINSVCGIRSTGRICTDLATELEREGHEVKIAYGRESVPEKFQKYAVRIGNDFDVKLHGLKARLADASGFGSKNATKKFIRWVKEYNPDVVHLHNIHGYYINIKILFDYLRESNKPVIWTLHDGWAFTGHCSKFFGGCTKWESRCYACPAKHTYPKSFVDRSSYNYVTKKQIFTSLSNVTVVTPSKWLADITNKSFLNKFKITVVNNGIDINVFKPTYGEFREKYQLKNKKIVLGVASAWGKSKGLYDFVKLAEKLDDRYQVVLVGVSEKQQSELPDNIIAISLTNSTEELAEIYTAADVFVNPTYSDTYPTVNLEAHACGTPVITYRTGGSVESAHADCIVEQGDIENLVKKIYCNDAKCKDGLVLDKSMMLNEYLEIYKNCVVKKHEKI